LYQVEVVVAKAAVVEEEVVAVMYDLTQVLWEVHQEEEVAAVSLVLLQRQQA
jgi:hypothetical protein